MVDIEKLLSPFTKAVIVGAAQINRKLVLNSISWKDVELFLSQDKSKPHAVKLCPDCNNYMALYQDEKDKDFCHWTCPKCRKGIPVNSSMRDELVRIINKREDKENGTR